MQPQWTPKVVNVALTTDTDAYTAGDVIGGLLSCDVPQIKGGGYIAWARIVDDGDQAKGYKLHCYYDTPTTIADDAAYAPTEADKLKRFTTLEFTSGNVNQDGADSDVFALGKDATLDDYIFFPVLASGKMYFYLEDVDASSPTAADDLTLDVCFMLM